MHLINLHAQWRPFYGPPDSPFLAPRGVNLGGDQLLVSDTGQNRVFLWHRLPTEAHQAPDVVLGQLAVSDTGRNRGDVADAATLQYPSGLWTDGQRLIVADAWNHRVLIWHRLPTKHGQPADVVIGQKDFTANAPNGQGVGHAPSAQSLYWPYGLTSDGDRLWIADTGNRRVLVYDCIPTTSYAAADRVIGQENFSERDYDHRHAIWPYSVKIGSAGQLAITDTQYYRVLLWSHWSQALEQVPPTLVGQPHQEANGQNQFGAGPQANTLNWCYDTCFDDEGLWVADTGNSRLLWFNKVPQDNNLTADGVWGPPDFSTGSENAATIHGTDQALYWPFCVAASPTHLAAADTGNHRIIIVQRTP